jgi:hypothetical protein
MRFKYIDSDGPVQTSFYGVEFVLGQYSEVSAPAAIAKLKGNRCFEQEAELRQEKPVKVKRKVK